MSIELKDPSVPVDGWEISRALSGSARQLARLGYELGVIEDLTNAGRVVFAVQRFDPEADEAAHADDEEAAAS